VVSKAWLSERECQVWWAPVTASAPGVEVLDASERERLSRLRRAQDRDRFVTAHALLRRVAALHLGGLDPAAVELTNVCPKCGDGDHGQPRIVGPSGLFVSLSHAGSWAAVAITRAGPVGIDVEAIDALTPLAAGDASETLSAAERQWWQRLPAAQKAPALAVVWTRKEALLKAAGAGFQIEPSALTLTVPGEPPRLLDWMGQSPPGAALVDVSPDGFYAGSVAVFTDQELTVTTHSGG
jgi:4'-phosphopantetheinyl transferase